MVEHRSGCYCFFFLNGGDSGFVIFVFVGDVLVVGSFGRDGGGGAVEAVVRW